MTSSLLLAPAAAATLYGLHRLRERLRLSLAKHPSLGGHSRWSRRVASFLPYFSHDSEEVLRVDDAPTEVVERRQAALEELSTHFRTVRPRTLEAGRGLEQDLSDVAFVDAYRVPFPFRDLAREYLPVGRLLAASSGVQVEDLDGNRAYDLSGAYGVNVFGLDFYKESIERGAERVRSLGPSLGPYHPVVVDNARRLKEISGMEEVSFHMSGTEAVMQAVRLARYHTRRRYLVRFCGAYHGWWDGVQPGVGNPRPVHDVYTLREMHPRTLDVLRRRRDIACVLVNPLQALHPNSGAPSDATLIDSGRRAHYDREAYAAWLRELRQVCTERGIVLLFDEVFMGFRLARGGVQEYFGVRADMVTYGKTVGGGLPIGVVCGPAAWMKRFREDRPSDVCFARGTFNSHPYVMGAMNEVLLHLDRPEVRAQYEGIDELWEGRVRRLNGRLAAEELPLAFACMTSVWTTLYLRPGAYNWLLQYYLRREGLHLPWTGTGRFIFSHAFGEEDMLEVEERVLRAARAMRAGGWWEGCALSNREIRRRVARRWLRIKLGRG